MLVIFSPLAFLSMMTRICYYKADPANLDLVKLAVGVVWYVDTVGGSRAQCFLH